MPEGCESPTANTTTETFPARKFTSFETHETAAAAKSELIAKATPATRDEDEGAATMLAVQKATKAKALVTPAKEILDVTAAGKGSLAGGPRKKRKKASAAAPAEEKGAALSIHAEETQNDTRSAAAGASAFPAPLPSPGNPHLLARFPAAATTHTLKGCFEVLRDVKQHQYSCDMFNKPVNPLKEKLYDYFEVIKEPMDFGTIEEKLFKNCYAGADEFRRDMCLVFDNCAAYNNPNSDAAEMGKAMRQIFEEGWNRRESSAAARAAAVPAPLPSTGNPHVLARVPAAATTHTLKICLEVLRDVKQHVHSRKLFNKPVDPVAMGLDGYFEVVKEPMDFATIREKLREKHYASSEFHRDMCLVFDNWAAANAPDSAEREMGEAVRRFFEKQWNQWGSIRDAQVGPAERAKTRRRRGPKPVYVVEQSDAESD